MTFQVSPRAVVAVPEVYLPAIRRDVDTAGLSRLTPIKTPTIGFWPGESPGAAFGAFRYPSCTE